MISVEVKVGLKKGVSDPEGANTVKSLKLLGYDEVESVRFMKVYRMDVEGNDREKVKARVEEMCERLLTNPVVNYYEITFL